MKNLVLASSLLLACGDYSHQASASSDYDSCQPREILEAYDNSPVLWTDEDLIEANVDCRASASLKVTSRCARRHCWHPVPSYDRTGTNLAGENSRLTYSQATMYCGCIIDVASKRWDVDTMYQDPQHYTDILIEDGVVDACLQQAGVTKE
jgi:hypothetical protein